MKVPLKELRGQVDEQDQRMRTWAERNGYRHAPSAHCLHWVSVGRCAVRSCEYIRGDRPQWMDHVSGWTRNGERLLLYQPYVIEPDGLRTLVEACERFRLTAVVHGDGWYGHGTCCIELRPVDETTKET